MKVEAHSDGVAESKKKRMLERDGGVLNSGGQSGGISVAMRMPVLNELSMRKRKTAARVKPNSNKISKRQVFSLAFLLYN